MTKQISDLPEDLFRLGLKAVILNDKKQVLLLQSNPNVKTQIKCQKEYWDFPGGQINYNETIPQSLKRELCEETALKGLTILEPIAQTITKIRITPYNRDVGLIIFAFHSKLKSVNALKLSQEHLNWKWFNPSQLKSVMGNKYDNTFINQIKKFIITTK